MVFGFLAMGILVARTYTDSMPLPQRVVGPTATGPPRRGHLRTADLPAPRTAAVRLDDGRRRLSRPGLHRGVPRLSADHVGQQLRDSGSPDRPPTQTTVRTNRYDEASGTMQFTAEQVGASTGSAITTTTSSASTPRIWPDPTGRSPTRRRSTAHRVLRLDRLGCRADVRTGLLLHQQLAARKAGRQRPDRRHPGLEALSLIALLAGLGALFALYGRWSRRSDGTGGSAVARVPSTGRGGVTPPSGPRLVLLRRRLALPRPDAARAAPSSTTAPMTSFFGLDLARCCPTTWPAPGTCSSRCSGPRAFLAGRHFLAPIIAGREPRRQGVADVRAARRRCWSCRRQPDRRGIQLHGVAAAEGSSVFGQRVGVPGPAAILADPADHRDVLMDCHHVPRSRGPAGNDESRMNLP